MQLLEEIQARYKQWEQQVRAEGHDAGRKEGRKEGIRALCRTLGIPITTTRERQMNAADGAALKKLLEDIQSHGRWP